MRLSGCVAVAAAGLTAGATGGFWSAVVGSLLFCLATIAATFFHIDRRVRAYWRTTQAAS